MVTTDQDSDTEREAELEAEDQDDDAQRFVGKDRTKWANSLKFRTSSRNLVKLKPSLTSYSKNMREPFPGNKI